MNIGHYTIIAVLIMLAIKLVESRTCFHAVGIVTSKIHFTKIVYYYYNYRVYEEVHRMLIEDII